MMKNSCIQPKVSCLLQSPGIHLDLNIWLYFQTFNSFLFQYFNSNIKYIYSRLIYTFIYMAFIPKGLQLY